MYVKDMFMISLIMQQRDHVKLYDGLGNIMICFCLWTAALQAHFLKSAYIKLLQARSD